MKAKRCKHTSTCWYERGADPQDGFRFVALLNGGPGIGTTFAHKLTCTYCGAQLALGRANREMPAYEILASEIIADAAQGVGLGGHRPEHIDGEHCWHYGSDECDMACCCYCGGEYPSGSECQPGAIVAAFLEKERCEWSNKTPSEILADVAAFMKRDP